MSDRPMRGCDVCGGVDDHPRHQFDANGHPDYQLAAPQEAIDAVYEKAKDLDPRDLVSIIKDLQDPSFQSRHMDCCREAGCPDGTCDKMPQKLHDLRGYALVEAITGEKVK